MTVRPREDIVRSEVKAARPNSSPIAAPEAAVRTATTRGHQGDQRHVVLAQRARRAPRLGRPFADGGVAAGELVRLPRDEQGTVPLRVRRRLRPAR